MNHFKKNAVLWLCILAGLVSVGVLLWERHQVEAANKRVEITLDYDDVAKLSEQSGHDLKWWLSFFRQQGCGSVAINEESLFSLRKSSRAVEYDIVENICRQKGWQKEYPAAITAKITDGTYKNQYLIACTQNPALGDFIENGMAARYDAGSYEQYSEGGIRYFVLKSDFDQLLYSSTLKAVNANTTEVAEIRSVFQNIEEKKGLGFDEKKVRLIQACGLKPILRPMNWNKQPQKLVQAFAAELKKYGIQPNVHMVGGSELVGTAGGEKELFEMLEADKTAIALVETPVQRSNVEVQGIRPLTEALGYNAVRVFSIENYIQKRYRFYNYPGSEEIENTLYRAITERNIRLVYFKPFKWNDALYVTDDREYARMFSSLENRLNPHGIRIGDFSVMPSHTAGRIHTGLAGLGAIAVALLVLERMIAVRMRWKIGILIFGGVGIFAGLWIAPYTMPALLAFGAAVLFSGVSAAVVIAQMKAAFMETREASSANLVMASVKSLWLPFLLALTGGLYVGGLLSDTPYLLEMEFFRGVKLAQAIPLGVATLAYVLCFGYRRKNVEIQRDAYYPMDFKNIVFEDINVLYVVLGAVAGGVVFYYMARTGHETNVMPSDAEMIGRNFLENVLLARPRTKEFLTGYPVLMLAWYFARRKWKLLLYPTAMVGVIGITSIVNTFCHLRTPLYLSLFRISYGVGLGLAVGVVGLFVLHGVVQGMERVAPRVRARFKTVLIKTHGR